MQFSGYASGRRSIAPGAILHDHRERIEFWRRDELQRVAVVMVERRAAHEQLGLDQIAPASVIVEGDVAAIRIGAEGLFQEIGRADSVSGVAALRRDRYLPVIRPGLARGEQDL